MTIDWFTHALRPRLVGLALGTGLLAGCAGAPAPAAVAPTASDEPTPTITVSVAPSPSPSPAAGR